MTNKGGRPTKFTPEVILEINEYLREAIPENMAIPTVEGIALKLGINRDTLYEWAKKENKKKYPGFSDTLGKLKMMQKEALVKTGIFGGKEINQTIVALLLKVNHDMIETSRQEITGAEGKELKIEIIEEDKKKFKK